MASFLPPPHTATGTPFASAEEAWFWFIRARAAECDGARTTARHAGPQRPCEPIDILHILDRLQRNRMVTIDHLHILRFYGRRQLPPDATRFREQRAAVLWRQAMDRLEIALVKRGIVTKRPFLSVVGYQEKNHAS